MVLVVVGNRGYFSWKVSPSLKVYYSTKIWHVFSKSKNMHVCTVPREVFLYNTS